MAGTACGISPTWSSSISSGDGLKSNLSTSFATLRFNKASSHSPCTLVVMIFARVYFRSSWEIFLSSFIAVISVMQPIPLMDERELINSSLRVRRINAQRTYSRTALLNIDLIRLCCKRSSHEQYRSGQAPTIKSKSAPVQF